jgi:2-oxoglutarate dehydrogenase E1 component
MQDGVMELLWKNAHLYGGNLSYVEQLYETYLMDPNAVPQEWREEFDRLPKVGEHISQDVPHSPIREHFLYLSKNQGQSRPVEVSSVSSEHEKKQVRVLRMINAYRVRGHQAADIDPLDLHKREPVPDLDLRFHELSEADYDTVFQLGSLFFGTEEAPLKQIVEDLKRTYCTTVGAEYMHIVDTQEKRWLQQRIEPVRCHPVLEVEERKHILERLTAAEGLEKYLGARYAGAKRFGVEGGEVVGIDHCHDDCPGGVPAPPGERGREPPSFFFFLGLPPRWEEVFPSGPWPPWHPVSSISRSRFLAFHRFLNSRRSVTLIALKF